MGDKIDADGKFLEEELELWMRDPVDCIKDLIQNPAFENDMAYAPERVYRDKGGTNQIVDEMWTASWWWDVQVMLVAMLWY
jgi:Plavaka transposase